MEIFFTLGRDLSRKHAVVSINHAAAVDGHMVWYSTVGFIGKLDTL